MRNITLTQALRETLDAILERDPATFVMGEDIGIYGGSFGVTRGLIEKYGAERIRDTPISEQALTGCAIGAAVAGRRPIIEFMFMDFITLGTDQLVNLAAKLKPIYGVPCPLVVRAPTGAGRGYGATHSQTLERFFFGVPGIKIVAPSNATDASALLQTAVADNNPVLFLEHKLLYPLRFPFPDELPPPMPFGQAEVVNEGDDVTIVSWGYMTALARQAAAKLASLGIGADIVDLRTLAPLDMETVITSVQTTGRVILLEEGPKTGGVSAEIESRILDEAFEYLEKPIRRLASPDFPVPAAKSLEAHCVPTVDEIVASAQEMIA